MQSTDFAQQVGAALGAVPLRPRLPDHEALEGAIAAAMILVADEFVLALAEQCRSGEITREAYIERLLARADELHQQGKL
jgi:hypothetical protein